MQHCRTFVYISAALSAVPCCIPAAYAQAAPATAQLEEIVVTAQKRAQNLQDVPLAVTAITGAAVEKLRLFNISDVAQLTPSFALGQQSPSQPTLTIRGVGSTDREAGSDRSVVPFVDEVYIGRTSAATFDIFDVERVEVLRGPQGTLFGRNVSGGAISITTVKPQDVFEGKVQLTGGNFKRAEARGAVNVPLNNQVAMRLTGTATRQDGYYNNVFLRDDNIEGSKRYDGRYQIQYKDDGGRTLLFSVDYSKADIHGLAGKTVAGQNSDAFFRNSLLGFVTPAFPLRLPADGPYNVENNIVGFSYSKGVRTYFRFEQDIGIGKLTLLPAYVWSNSHEARDQPGIPILFAGAQTSGFNSQRDERESYHATSFEARLADQVGDLNWVVGAFVLGENVHRAQAFIRQSNNAYSNVLWDQQARNDSVAAFGQISWKFASSFELTAGARSTSDKKHFGLAAIDLLTPAQRALITAQLGRAPTITPLQETFNAAASNTYSSVTPRVSLGYQPLRDLHFYASWARGFKSGGFDGNAPTAVGLGSGFQPETVDTFELGTKSTLFDRRLRVNLAVFDSKFTNLQLRDRRVLDPNDPNNFVVVVINAAQASIRGVEAEISAQVTPELNLSFSGSKLDTKIEKVQPGATLFTGTRLPRAPDYQLVGSASYRLEAERSGLPFDFELGGSYKRTGLQFFDVNEQLGGKQPTYNLVDAHLTMSPQSGAWNVSFWGKNLTKTVYFSDAQSTTTATSGRATVRYGEPRTFGATFTTDF